MANNTHAVINGTHASYWDVDALNYVGIAATEMDNGTFVDLGAMSPAADGAYEFTVTASSTSADFVCATPPQGYNVASQVYDDPRYFTNEANKPISVKYLPKYDCIELSEAGFTTAPATETYAKVAAGKLTAQTDASGAQFKILGTRTMDIGGELINTWVLQKIV